MSGKTQLGNFFEDFALGQIIEHATPRTITEGDLVAFVALAGILAGSVAALHPAT